MIKKIIFTILACLSTLAVYSQQEFKPKWYFGAGFGPTFSSADFAESTSVPGAAITTKNISQFAGGIAVKYESNKNLGFIAELNFSQQGWEQEFKGDLSTMGFTHSRKLNYIELPFLTHIYFGNKVRFIINLGPKIGYVIGQKEEISQELVDYIGSGNAADDFVTHQYFREVDNKFDYGILGGLGVQFNTRIGSFALEGRYYYGLSDMYNNKKSDHFARSANQVISAKLSYYISLF